MPSLRSLAVLAVSLATCTLAAPAAQASSAAQTSLATQAASTSQASSPAQTSPATQATSASQASSPLSSAVSQTSSAAGASSATQASPTSTGTSGSSGYWLADVDHSHDYVWGGAPNYTIFRNVQDYGAKGDGSTDDTVAINNAIAFGNRCGQNTCNSSTVTPAIVYFPAGTYVVSSPLIMYYYTQMIGDANTPPTLQASSDFNGIGVLDSDPYNPGGSGSQWYTNQNNFFRQVRNFIIDISATTPNASSMAAGIHWQVAQATSLQNIVFQMSSQPNSGQRGIFMENGSGGFFSNLTFNGGSIGAWLGNQQFTTRNLIFNNCETAIFMDWNWGWTLQGITITGGTTAIDMSSIANLTAQTVGSVILADSTITGAQYGIRTAYSTGESWSNGTLILDNVNVTSVPSGAVVDVNNQTIVGPGSYGAWGQGNGYTNSTQGSASEGYTNSTHGPAGQGSISIPPKPSSLLDSKGSIFTNEKPQYQTTAVGSVLSAMSCGLAGDGVTDDTKAMQAFLDHASQTNQLAYFEHGAYLISDTIQVPTNVQIVGEIWPLIVANGNSSAFSDQSNPTPVWQIGCRNATENGSVQISDLIFETIGPAPGAIMIEWNLQSEQGASGIWDTHVRIGGSYGTNLEPAQCALDPTSTDVPTDCLGVFLMFWAGPSASGVYLENTWFWVADHSLDADAPEQLSIYSGRGMLIEAQGPVWLWGTAAEHSVLYNYQFVGTKALFAGFMQSETPYFQPNPLASQPFTINHSFNDPSFAICNHTASGYCEESWGLHIKDAEGVVIYGAGLYSFFQNYAQTCVPTNSCQQTMVHIRDSEVSMYGLTTVGAVDMLVDAGLGSTIAGGLGPNRGTFGDTVAFFVAASSG